MRSFHRIVMAALAATAAVVWVHSAAAQGGANGQWIKRTPRSPDPSKVVVPQGYKVEQYELSQAAGQPPPIAR